MILVSSFFLVCSVFSVPVTKDYWLLLISSLFVFTYIAESLQLYRSWRLGSFAQMLRLVFFVCLISFASLIALLFAVKQAETFSRLALFSWMLLAVASLITWRWCAKQIKAWRRARGHNLQSVAIVGLTASGQQLYQQIQQHSELGFDCLGFYDDRSATRLPESASSDQQQQQQQAWFEQRQDLYLGDIEQLIADAKSAKIRKIYLCLPLKAEERIQQLIARLGDSTVDVLLVPDFLLNNLMHARVGAVGDTVSVFESPLRGIRDFYKRSFDVAFSLSVLLCIAPVMLMIAAAIKLTSKGPVLFKQDRYGLGGEKIGVYKFRSMTVMDNSAVVKQATKGDARITKLGAFLRKTSLDELPQFFNVLFGHMSVVGPLPHAVAHNEQYRQVVDFYMLRHKVRPGITGLAQVNGWRGETDTLEKIQMRVKYDLEYIRHWSLILDLKIVFLTLFKGFVNKNAY